MTFEIYDCTKCIKICERKRFDLFGRVTHSEALSAQESGKNKQLGRHRGR